VQDHAKEECAIKAKFSKPLVTNNTCMPLTTGITFVYQGNDAKKSIYEEFIVTDQTK
jgi:hypothetical protein